MADARPDSDLDVLVEFEPEHVPGLAFFAMEQELSELLGRKVDLKRPNSSVRTSANGSSRRPKCNMSQHDTLENLDFDILWQVITHDLPPLIAELENIR